MATTFQIYSAYDMANPLGMSCDALSGVVTNNTATSFTVRYATSLRSDATQWITTVTGSGFTYGQTNGQLGLTGGTIASELANNGSRDVYFASSLSVSVAADGALSSGAAELNLWLAGASSITGSAGRDSLLAYAGNQTITGGGGIDRVVFSGTKASYTVTANGSGNYTVADIGGGGGGTDTLLGITYLKFSDGYYQAAPAGQAVNGSAGNDTLSGGFGNDTIDGAGGNDTVVFSGPFGDHTISLDPVTRGYFVQDSTGFDGTYLLKNISTLQFADQSVSFAGQSIRGTAADETFSGGYGNDTITGGGGVDTVALTGAKANYTVTGDAQSGFVVTDNVGLDGVDTLYGITKLQYADQTVVLPPPATGTSGNDTIYSGPGNDTIDGGGGTDTVVLSGNRADYTVTKTPTGYKVLDNLHRDGNDTISNIQLLRFADTTVNTAAVTAANYETVVQELYIAYFGRPADTGGLVNFENALLGAGAPNDIAGLVVAYSANPSVQGLVDAFGLSAESGRLYPSTDTGVFVTAIFNNVFNRDPLPAGKAYWTDAIDNQGLTKGNAALAIMNGALQNSTTQGLIDAAGVINKVSVGINFTFNIDTTAEVTAYRGATAAGIARNMLTAVNSSVDPASTQMQATVADTLTAIVAAPPPAPGMVLPAADAAVAHLVGLPQAEPGNG